MQSCSQDAEDEYSDEVAQGTESDSDKNVGEYGSAGETQAM